MLSNVAVIIRIMNGTVNLSKLTKKGTNARARELTYKDLANPSQSIEKLYSSYQ